MTVQTIVLGGGCFWCTEAVFEQVQGVQAVESGYCNGHFPNPSYEQVCTGQTGHAEVVRVTFEADQIRLQDILAIFFATHDPTTLNRQGHDVGTQYRSGIFCCEEEQVAVARAVLLEAQHAFGGRVVTEVVALKDYSRAEDEHQRYFARHPGQGYCAAVIAPKVAKFRKVFADRLKPT